MKIISDVLCISITDLTRVNTIRKGNVCCGEIYINGTNIKYEIDYTGLILICNLNLNIHGISVDRQIKICQRKSNLGDGLIPYFVCPKTKAKCRKLYFDESVLNWGCRTSFYHRLYYPLQSCSKINRYSVSYDAIIKDLRKTIVNKEAYNNRPTKAALKRRKLEKKLYLVNICKISPLAFPKNLRKFFPENFEQEIRHFIVSYRHILKNLV